MKIQNGLDVTPQAAQPNALLIQQVGLETLVYDERTHQAFCLNPVASEVWRRLDGIQTPGQIGTAASVALGTPVTEEAVLFAVAELRGNGLIAPAAAAMSPVVPSRRDLLRQLGAGAIVMLPAVAAIMAPKAAEAYNGCVNCNAHKPTSQVEHLPTAPAHPGGNGIFDPSFTVDANSNDGTTKNRRRNDGEIFVP